jgi:hypothetical protein
MARLAPKSTFHFPLMTTKPKPTITTDFSESFFPAPSREQSFRGERQAEPRAGKEHGNS